MKNFILLIVVFFFSCTSGEAQTVYSCQQNDIHISPMKSQIVDVIFSIDSFGKAKVLEIHSKDIDNQLIVLDRLSNIQLDKNSALIGKVIHYRFDFSELGG